MRAMWRPVAINPDAALPATLLAAFLLAVPVAAQTVPPPTGAVPPGAASTTPATEGGAGTPAAAPGLESPALGPLGGREGPPVTPALPGGALAGFANTTPGLGIAGISTPFELGNRTFGVRPSIGVDVLGTNNLFQTKQDPRSDVVVTIAPSLEAAISTSRMSGVLRYTPALRLYGTYSNQNGLEQIGDGQFLGSVVPGTLYLDMRGAARALPVTPGQIPGSGQVAAGGDIMQTYTAQVSPFLVHRFGGMATAQAGYSFQYSQQNWASFNNSNVDTTAANFTAHRGFAVLRTGEDFGRLALQARTDGTWYVGNGIYNGAHNFVSALEARYAILRSVALLGEIGYENQQYAGTNPLTIEDAIWSVGVRLTPDADSIVIARYGHHDGFNSFSLNAGVALGQRTELYASYRDTIGTSLTRSQDLLATTTTDSLGNPVDSQSGAPVLLINSFLGLSNTLYRTRVGEVTLRHSWPRDTFTLSASWQSQDPITSAINTVPVAASSGVYGNFTWSHEFSPRTTGVATLQYGHVNYAQTGNGASDIYALTGTLMHRLSDKLVGGLQVAWTTNNSSLVDQGYSQGVIRLGFRRTF